MITTRIKRARLIAGLALAVPLVLLCGGTSGAASARPAGHATAASATEASATGASAAGQANGLGTAPGAGFGDWPGWQANPTGSRSNPAEWQINPFTVGKLKLKWAFAFPKGPDIPAKSQPAVVGNRMYFGGPDGKFYSVDAHTGRTRWSYDLGQIGSGGFTAVLDSPTVAGNRVYFGNARGYLFALDRFRGTLIWAKHVAVGNAGLLTSSPLYYHGRIYIGTSSAENTGDSSYPCCTFRGHIDSVDARTGKLVWRYYTVPKAHRAGNWPSGAAKYAPSGAGVWSTPVVDPTSGTLYVGTGENYTGSAGDFDSMLALNAKTGAVRWKQQMNNADTWRSTCNGPNAEKDCPELHKGIALDYDIGASPNIFRVHGQLRVGVGQKSGVYHVFDARTGKIIWQRELSKPFPSGGISGIQWGTSYDGVHLYVATYYAEPGTLYALDPATGKTVWKTPNPADGCTTGGAAKYKNCDTAMQPAVSSTPGVVYEGSTDGKMRAFSAWTGKVLWQYDTVRDFTGVNGRPGHGSAISGGSGAVISHGMLYVLSGYPAFPSTKGFVLLAFGL